MLVHVRRQVDSAATSTARSPAEATGRLLEQLRRGGDGQRIADQLAEANLGLAKSLARRYYGLGERAEDLDQAAYLGLVKAARRFDPERGRSFMAFAVPTILGELRRHFRDHCWVVRPPRRVQELQARIPPAADEFEQQHGRGPTAGELAEVLGADLDDVVEALSADGCFTPASLDRPTAERSPETLADTLGIEDDGYHRIESTVVLRPLIRALPDRDRRVIELRFYRDWTQQQIADDIRLTQMQVSRILARVLRELRSQLDDYEPAV